MDPSEGHLNGILAQVGGNLNNYFKKVKCLGGFPGGMLKLQFDRYIRFNSCTPCSWRDYKCGQVQSVLYFYFDGRPATRLGASEI